MKAITNRANFNRNTTVYVVVGYYDESGVYHEEALGNFAIKELPTKMARNIYPDHDITMQIAPKEEVRIFAKSISILESFKNLHNDNGGIKGMFDSFSEYIGHSENGEYIWTTFDIE